jgi:hypothetical protein
MSTGRANRYELGCGSRRSDEVGLHVNPVRSDGRALEEAFQARRKNIRLGDVVVSRPHKVHGGVVQHDIGKATPSGFERTGILNTPPTILLNAISEKDADYLGYFSKA